MASSVYLAISIILTAFGFVSMASIGLPFLLLGLSLLFAFPIRERRDILFPILFGELAFFVAAALVAPWGCRSRTVSTGAPSIGHTVCDNPLGLDYSGAGAYVPPLWPALLAGVVAGLAAAWLTHCHLASGPSSS